MINVVASITDFFGPATSCCHVIALFMEAATHLRKATKRFFQEFKHRKLEETQTVLRFKEDRCSDTSNTIYDVRDLRGDLAPIIDVKKPSHYTFTDVSKFIHEAVTSSKARNPIHDFLKINTLEWIEYGCSIQSDCKSDVQLLLLIENEEANNIPVAVSSDYFEDTYSSMLPNILGHSVRLTGPAVSVTDPKAALVLGSSNMELLRLSGSTSVIVPDEELVERMQIDFSYKPEILFNKPSSCFLGFLWVTYIDEHTMDIYPIYEYGNIGAEEDFELLADKLIHQIEFFKSRIWREKDIPPEERRYRLALAYNDKLYGKVQEHFREEPFEKKRKDIMTLCRRWIADNALQRTR